VFLQVAVILAISAAVGGVALLLRQPLIVGFIAAGILIGPQMFGLVESPAEIELLAKIGISLLLFVVGLKLDLRLVRTLGPVALATGLGQVVFTSAIGYAIAIGLGLSPVAALYTAIALTFSSTIIIVKLLSDKGETEELHGRIAIGFLIVQDIVVVLVMIGLSAFGQPGETGLALEFALVVAKAALLLGVIWGSMRWLLPPLLDRIARNPEILVLFAVTWAVVLAAGSELLGFSEEVGAFVAGVSLASTPYREAIGGRLSSLRDFLLLFFFIDLGARLDLGHTADLLGPAIVLSLFVLIGNPLIVMVIMGRMGYRSSVSFRSGLTVAQISEFSLILVALGFGLGHIDESTVGLVTTVGLITIGTSTYLIYNSAAIFRRLSKPLAIFERKDPGVGFVEESRSYPDVIVVGLGRFGTALAASLRAGGKDVFGVDYDPQAVKRCEQQGVPVLYGDAEDPELPAALPLAGAGWVVVSIRHLDVNAAVLSYLREHGFSGKVAVSADTPHEAELLRAAGADLVIQPFTDAAEQTAGLL
jgi:Kef-type K+ transport system membrane component KefB